LRFDREKPDFYFVDRRFESSWLGIIAVTAPRARIKRSNGGERPRAAEQIPVAAQFES